MVTGDIPLQVITVHDARGTIVPVTIERGRNHARIRLPDVAGLYFVRLRVGGTEVLKRVVRR